MTIGQLILIIILSLGWINWIIRGTRTRKWDPLDYTFLEFMFITIVFYISIALIIAIVATTIVKYWSIAL